ncbi:copper chaperone PCu(A)C [Bradyrhizobium sp. 61]|uniref:copper chaperone PCu(A)C n=1 Tax=unclassified Bradyrhizobium TaxID=2631580 RepID=UPI001FF7CDE6|nr:MULTISPECIES: copper chaperone PCu(A)C [unclassified Bradyrhizobium]MCK1277378.1 copper chaperone PCu(A)C [Bradyrhizobium sp. 61]MCK1440954.1 copper chaperone PCu(A)C [Bradyrhizobium sp. 48]MCK1465606.1 copper chaperone PCu(A)C [Bradyrhizobium sp. 2]
MKRVSYQVAVVLLAFGIGGASQAQTPAANSIVVEQPWARATPPGAKTGAAYLTVMNNGATPDRLLGATTPLADKVEFHKETEESGVSRMREVPSVEVQPGAKVTFKPGEMHMMMVGLKQPLKEGQNLPLTLQFEKAGNVAVTASIGNVGAMKHGNMGAMPPGSSMGK